MTRRQKTNKNEMQTPEVGEGPRMATALIDEVLVLDYDETEDIDRIRETKTAANFIREALTDDSRDNFVSVYLDATDRIVGYTVVATGIATFCATNIRELLQLAVLQGAVALIVGHNHPKGSSDPSPEDREITTRIKEAGKLIGISLIDHIVVDEYGYFAFSESSECKYWVNDQTRAATARAQTVLKDGRGAGATSAGKRLFYGATMTKRQKTNKNEIQAPEAGEYRRMATSRIPEVEAVYRGLDNTIYHLRRPKSVADFIRVRLPDNLWEHFVFIYLDATHSVIGYSVIAAGTANSCVVQHREIFQSAVLQGAVALIVGHNHPTEEANPSPEDREIAIRIKEAGKLIGIPLFDYVVVGDNTHFAFSENRDWTN